MRRRCRFYGRWMGFFVDRKMERMFRRHTPEERGGCVGLKIKLCMEDVV